EIGRGELARPEGVAVDGAGRIYVADPGAGGLFFFGPGGDLLARTDEVASPGDLALAPGGTVFVCDPGGGRLVAFAPDLGAVKFAVGRVFADPGPRALGEPRGVACSGGRIAVADAQNGRVLVGPLPTAEDPVLRASLLLAPFGFEPQAVAFGRDGRLFAVDRGAVRAFSADGRDLGAFRARAVRAWYEPRGLAADGRGFLFSVDGSTRRVLGTTEDLYDDEPRIELDPHDPTRAVVEWRSLSPRPSVVRWGPTEACEREARDEEPKTAHRIVLRGLEPSTRYYLHVSDPLEAVPPATPPRSDLPLRTQRTSYALLSAGNFSGEYPFATGPGRGRAEWASLPVIVLVYLRVGFPPGPDGSKSPDRALAEADLDVLRSELETYRVWVWRHSRLKLNLDFSWVIVAEARESTELGEVTPTVLRDIERGLAAQGKRVGDFWNAIVVGTHGWYAHYLAGTVAGSDHELGSCYVGFGPGTRPGWWWFPTHEHGHLIHSMVMCSNAGHFAFPDAPWTLPGKFGENFSFLAYDYRQFPPRGWLLLKTSALRSSLDRNGNGVPDDDPSVPLDERRFGWTEAMGGDCLRRILAGVRTPGFSGSEDVDFEGRRYRLNEGELYWTDRKVRRSTPSLDGRISEGEWTEIAFLPNLATPRDRRGVRARLFTAWDEGHYYVAVRASRKVHATFDLDGANDGWFHGRDNLRFSVRPEGPAPGARAEGAIWDFLHDTLHVHDGQHWWRGAYAPGDILAAAGEEGGSWVLECAVPARKEIGIRPRLGAKFALNARISSDPPDELPPTPFLDGEDFLYDLSCELGGGHALEASSAASAPAGSASGETPASADASGGWIPLWDGELVAAAPPGADRAPSWLLCEGCPRFRDFDFRAEVWTEPGAAAGILFHTEAARDVPPEKGYEVRIHNSCRPRGDGEPCDPRATGSLVGTRSVYRAPARDREWFPLEISVRGSRVVVRVNGLAAVDYVEPPAPKRSGPGRLLGEGKFAIAARGGEVRFRAIAARAAAAVEGLG
ncbi:MAG: family 16 glycoside hydrolase, partial [Planctomycetota bacterium]